jgi:hypothetical protein
MDLDCMVLANDGVTGPAQQAMSMFGAAFLLA